MNRSYQFAGVLQYTGWWINPNIQLGDTVRIDGDAPATNNLLRATPFTVTDLISRQIHEHYFLCSQLSYESGQPQYETYLYEFHTGILLRAVSVILDGNKPAFEVNLEIVSASPPLPTIHLLLHYWINYHSLILAFIGATLVVFFINYLIQNLLPQHQKLGKAVESKQNA